MAFGGMGEGGDGGGEGGGEEEGEEGEVHGWWLGGGMRGLWKVGEVRGYLMVVIVLRREDWLG